MFKKILIANRGEIAVRVIRTCRDLGIVPVAVYSEVDRRAMHVRLADQAICIGPAPAVDSYLRMDRILEAALSSGCEAVHPGYGFLAENAQFARDCSTAGLTFIGPHPDSIELMGDKLASRRAVRAEGVETVPGSNGPVSSEEEAISVASGMGFPMLIKASAGGGGKGMRIVRSREGIAEAFRSARGEAASAFGDDTLYLEKLLERARHIEIQILADQSGNLVYLGERECSIQRRHQKLVEECPSPLVDEVLRRRMGEAAIAVARAARYVNAGTVEFLVEDQLESAEPSFYFLEMNTRLQVEHPVTEMVTGLDLVEQQIRIAAGQPLGLKQSDVQPRGAAIECRIYAEDPDRDFFPSPGKLSTYREPSGPGIRTDAGVDEGFQIPLEYDPLISKLIAYGADRTQAIQRMKRALGEYKIGGVKTTLPFFHRLMNHPDYLEGELATTFIRESGLDLPAATGPDEEIRAVIAASVRYRCRQEDISTSKPSSQPSGWKHYSRRTWQ